MWLKCFTKQSLGNIGYKQRSSYWAHHFTYMLMNLDFIWHLIGDHPHCSSRKMAWLNPRHRNVTQQGYKHGLEGRRQEVGTPVRRIHSWNSSKYKTINICFGNDSRFNKFYDNIPGRFLWKSITDASKSTIHLIIN